MERTIYRIVDVNFNRAREAARTMEEYCRFVLNDPRLSARAKTVRHRLCAIVSRMDQGRLLTARDTEGDVGRELTIDGRMNRCDLRDCFTAAVRRFTEAMRVLGEVGHVVDSLATTEFEQLRFETYSIEKDVYVGFVPKSRFASVRLYVLLTVTDESDDRSILDLADQCSRGGADCLQLRPKGLSDQRLISLAEQFVERSRRHNVITIINDRADVAILCGADGVHLGQDDLGVGSVRALQLRPMIVGISTHNETELLSAIKQGADYVGLGPAFVSPTKPGLPVAGLPYIRSALTVLRDTSIGHVAIGGITEHNLQSLLACGISAVAVASAVGDSGNPETVCRCLKNILLNTPQNPIGEE